MYRSAARCRVLAPGRQSRVPAAVASFLPLIVCVLAAALLVGCAQPKTNLATNTKQASTKVAAVMAEPRAVAGGSDDAAADAEPKAVAKDGKQQAPATIWQTADKLMGLESEAVRAALGAPARIRDEDTARIYQYVGGDCVLDLFLYQAEGSYRVTYAEARSASAEAKPVDVCLQSLPGPIVAVNTQPST